MAGLTHGRPEAVGLDPHRLHIAGQLAANLVEQGTIPAAGIAVARHGLLVYRGAWGHTRREPPVAASIDALFAVASVTKPLTATAIMVLVSEGVLDLDAPVCAVIPPFGARGKDRITIRHLLTHTSGIDDTSMPTTPAATTEEHLARICALPALHAPGTRYAYCNAGYRLFGDIITRVTGARHETFFRQRLLAPLQMHRSMLRPDPSIIEHVAQVDRQPPWLMASLCASGSTAGGLFSTVVDLLRLGQLFLDGGMGPDGRILSERCIRSMTSDQAEGARNRMGQVVAQGFGWMLRPRQRFSARASPRVYAHPGATGMWLVVEPDLDLVVAFVANRWGWSGYGRRQVLDAVLDAVA